MSPFPMKLNKRDFNAIRAKAVLRKTKRAEKAAVIWPKKVKKQKTVNISKLEEIYWDVFSFFIRTRDKRANAGLCFYCELRPIDCAMHRIKRGKRATKYDERNVDGGCHSCNFEDKHNPQKFDAIFIRKKGLPLFLELVDLGAKECNRSRVDIVEKTDFYKSRVQNLLTRE